MRQRRWEKAEPGAAAIPTPLLPIPTNYDIKLEVNHQTLEATIGPLFPREPIPNYDNCTVQWRQGPPQQIVTGYDFKTKLKFKYPSQGVWKFKIDWYLGTKLRATTKYDLVV